MKTLKPNESKFWHAYLDSLPADARPLNPHIEATFAGKQEITDELIKLYLSGEKTAGSSLVKDFETAGDPLPAAGNYWIILNSKGNPSCIVKTVRVAVHLFKDIPEEIAKAEGEGNRSVSYWEMAHAELYAPYLNKLQISNLNNAEIITEFFEVVYPITPTS